MRPVCSAISRPQLQIVFSAIKIAPLTGPCSRKARTMQVLAIASWSATNHMHSQIPALPICFVPPAIRVASTVRHQMMRCIAQAAHPETPRTNYSKKCIRTSLSVSALTTARTTISRHPLLRPANCAITAATTAVRLGRISAQAVNLGLSCSRF